MHYSHVHAEQNEYDHGRENVSEPQPGFAHSAFLAGSFLLPALATGLEFSILDSLLLQVFFEPGGKHLYRRFNLALFENIGEPCFLNAL